MSDDVHPQFYFAARAACRNTAIVLFGDKNPKQIEKCDLYVEQNWQALLPVIVAQYKEWEGRQPKAQASDEPVVQILDFLDPQTEYERLCKIEAAAKCIRHWHDVALPGGDGMVVSAEAVRTLWEALG